MYTWLLSQVCGHRECGCLLPVLCTEDKSLTLAVTARDGVKASYCFSFGVEILPVCARSISHLYTQSTYTHMHTFVLAHPPHTHVPNTSHTPPIYHSTYPHNPAYTSHTHAHTSHIPHTSPHPMHTPYQTSVHTSHAHTYHIHVHTLCEYTHSWIRENQASPRRHSQGGLRGSRRRRRWGSRNGHRLDKWQALFTYGVSQNCLFHILRLDNFHNDEKRTYLQEFLI